MDRDQLTTALMPFVEECQRRGIALRDYCLEEAFPGDASSSYFLRVTAEWIDLMDCSGALDRLIDVLWDTVSVEIRTYIFAITIHDKNDNLHCWTSNTTREPQLVEAS
jgi:hypothetical protein